MTKKVYRQDIANNIKTKKYIAPKISNSEAYQQKIIENRMVSRENV